MKNTPQLTLKELIAEVDQKMREINYTEATLGSYRRRWRDLLEFAEEIGAEYFSIDFADRYLLEKCAINLLAEERPKNMPPWKVKEFKRIIYVLGDYQNHEVIVRKRRMNRVEIPEHYADMVAKFQEICTKRYNSQATINYKMQTVKAFLLYLEGKDVHEVSSVNAAHITGFVKTFVGQAQRTVGGNLSNLRMLFFFWYEKGYHQKDLRMVTPKVHCGRTVRIPIIWTKEEAQRILDSVDRSDAVGKRDYAILLLVTHLGIRDSDVQNLTFDNLDWKGSVISLIQTKTKRSLELPLSEEVGAAIIDYLKYGRPKIDKSPYVFVRHKSPYGKCINYYYLMRKYIGEAGIRLPTNRPHGLHSLRHTLATRLLEQGVTLETAAQILGHQSVNTTNIYVSTALENLRECALNPEEVFVNA